MVGGENERGHPVVAIVCRLYSGQGCSEGSGITIGDLCINREPKRRADDKFEFLISRPPPRRANNGHCNNANGPYKPQFLTDQELKHLVLEAADGFLFVVICETAEIIYVSDSVASVLNYHQNDWHGNNFFKFIHQDDIDKVKEQISSQESHTARILDMKVGNVKKEGHLSAKQTESRRGFICRMRIGTFHPDVNTMYGENSYRRRSRLNTLGPSTDGHHYSVIHCNGYIKSLSPKSYENPMSGIQLDRIVDVDSGYHCLVAIGRLQLCSVPSSLGIDNSTSKFEFTTRLCKDSKFSFVDLPIRDILGFTPENLLRKSISEFIHPDEQNLVENTFHEVLNSKCTLSMEYRFKNKIDKWVWLRTSVEAFLNPVGNAFEFFVCKNIISPKSLQDIPIVETTNSQVIYPPEPTTGIGYPLTTPNTMRKDLYNSSHNIDINMQPVMSTLGKRKIETMPPLSSVQNNYYNTPNQLNHPPDSLNRQASESYQYTQISPSHSPNEPIYTQLTPNIRQNSSTYHNPPHTNSWSWHTVGSNADIEQNPHVPNVVQPSIGNEIPDNVMQMQQQQIIDPNSNAHFVEHYQYYTS